MPAATEAIDASGIASAATYVNNLLLARGLLRDGKAIHFERLIASGRSHDSKRRKDDDKENAHERGAGADAARTTTQILNLIHDLVLGQDVSRRPKISFLHSLTHALAARPIHQYRPLHDPRRRSR